MSKTVVCYRELKGFEFPRTHIYKICQDYLRKGERVC